MGLLPSKLLALIELINLVRFYCCSQIGALVKQAKSVSRTLVGSVSDRKSYLIFEDKELLLNIWLAGILEPENNAKFAKIEVCIC